MQMTGQFADKMNLREGSADKSVGFELVSDPDTLEIARSIDSYVEKMESTGKLDKNPTLVRVVKILEEVAEMILASDEVAAFDALCDVMYLTLGAGEIFDMPLDLGFMEVHTSNMTKDNKANSPIVRDKGEGYVPPNLRRILINHRGRPKEMSSRPANTLAAIKARVVARNSLNSTKETES